MKSRSLILFLAILAPIILVGQNRPKTNLELEEMALKVVNDSIVEHRVENSQKLKAGLLQRLRQPKSLSDSFEEFTAVSIVNSGDGKFRIFSWQLFLDPDHYRHEAIIQFMDKRSKSPVVLVDKSDEIGFPDRKELSTDNWFGALYYNVIPFKSKGKTKYLLFGFDGATRAENCKIVDVLNLDKSGNITFGAPIFLSEVEGIKKSGYRHFHQYDQNVKAVLNYDPDQEIIIYDHLIPWTSKEFGVGMTFVPDGSYEGFELKRGTWRHIKKVYNYVSEVPITAENPLGKKQN